jgi:putative spermidine/putrescine transport system substrate-binding protein
MALGLDGPRPRDVPRPPKQGAHPVARFSVGGTSHRRSRPETSCRTGGRGTRLRTRLLEETLSSSRTMPRLVVGGAILAIVVAACGGGTTPAPATTTPTTAASSAASEAPTPTADPMAALIDAAKKEGNLTTIALPRSWCNYGALLDGFTAKYGIVINNLNPDGSSQQELDAITANKDTGGPGAPDVVDVGLSYGPKGVSEGLFQPYKVATWADIPDSAKDASGMWYGDYYGVMSFEINTSVVTATVADWSDLLNLPKNSVALAGDPTGSNQAVSAVWAAALANGGSLDNAQPGLDFFKQLNDKGIFVPVIGKTATMASGETPVRIAWTYNALADKDSLAGNPPINVVVPASGRFGGMYVQAISAYAPHPNAAKLWMEYLYSDEGQIAWMNGYCNGIRYDAMSAAGTIPADVQAKLPDSKGAVLPTLDQITAANTTITTGWPTTVGVTVK